MPCGTVDWIHLTKTGVQWRDHVNTSVNFRIHLGRGAFLYFYPSCDRNDRLKFVNSGQKTTVLTELIGNLWLLPLNYQVLWYDFWYHTRASAHGCWRAPTHTSTHFASHVSFIISGPKCQEQKNVKGLVVFWFWNDKRVYNFYSFVVSAVCDKTGNVEWKIYSWTCRVFLNTENIAKCFK
jgi:hypothetical protein